MSASWLSGFLDASLSAGTLQHPVQDAQWRRDGVWEVGGGGGGGEAEACLNRRNMQSNCVQSPEVQAALKGEIILPAEEHFPHMNLAAPPTHA